MDESNTRASLIEPKPRAASWTDQQVTRQFYYNRDYQYTRGHTILVGDPCLVGIPRLFGSPAIFLTLRLACH